MGLETIDIRRLALRPGDRLLDIGCGEGRHAVAASTSTQVDAFALDMKLADLATTRLRANDGHPVGQVYVTAGDALNLPFADHSFDRIICAEVLEHLHDYESALAEIRRVLKPGGLLAISVPRFGPEWICWRLSREYANEEGGHVRIFKSRQLSRVIERLGMFRYDRHWAHGLHAPYWWLKCMFYRRSEEVAAVRLYHRFLVWDLLKRPPLTRLLDALLTPLCGKSTVMYFVRGS